MVAITPNTYLYNRSALSLRKHFIENKFIQEIIDFESEKVFKGVSTYVCITIFTIKPKEFLIYNGRKIMYEDINEDFNIFGSNDLKHKSLTLNDLCTIRNGIATLRDKIYIHKHKLFDEPCWKPITKFFEENWIIYPYDNKGRILEEEHFKNANPQTYSFLEDHKEELGKRDKGNKSYPKWYSFGRTQSLIKSESNLVIYTPTFSDPKAIKCKISEPILYINCLCIELQKNVTEFSLENIVEIIQNNVDFIVSNSSKRGGGWINLSGSILKQIVIS
jgi:hypothetical protein